eukprot:scaffold4416_cov228-Prasinococcus_capsulatus_cf.AAC.2
MRRAAEGRARQASAPHSACAPLPDGSHNRATHLRAPGRGPSYAWSTATRLSSTHGRPSPAQPTCAGLPLLRAKQARCVQESSTQQEGGKYRWVIAITQ